MGGPLQGFGRGWERGPSLRRLLRDSRKEMWRRRVSFLNPLEAVTQEGDLSFLSLMTARVCVGGSLPLLESPKWAERGKGPLEAHDSKA